MKRSSKRSALTLIAATSLAIIGTGICSQGQTQSQAVRAASSRADETLEMWNLIGNRLIAMVQDFPEDKYDFKLHKDERTFAENILHVAAVDYDLIRSAGGSSLGPDFRKEQTQPFARPLQDENRRGETDPAGRGGRSKPDSTTGRRGAGRNCEACVGETRWSTDATSECSLSSTALSIVASLSSLPSEQSCGARLTTMIGL
jgi:hypothetical protein